MNLFLSLQKNPTLFYTRKNFGFCLLAIFFLLLGSCADESNVDQPAQLQPFQSNYYLHVGWLASTGKGVGDQYLFLEPLMLKKIAVTTSRNGVINVTSLKTGKVTDDINLNTTISAGVGGDENLWLVVSRDAHVIAIDAKTRKVKWRTRVSSEVLSKPVIYQNMVLIRSIDGKIVSLDKNTGKLRWQYEQAIPNLTLRGTSELVLSRGRIIAGLADGKLVALSPDTGAVIWNVALAVPKGSSEIQRLVDIDGYAELYGRILYAVSFQGRIAAIDVEHGRFLWARNFSSQTGLVVDDKAVYTTDENGFVWALDRYNGATLWKQTALAHRKVTRPTVIGNYLAVGDYDGYIHILSKFDGHFIARYQLGQYDHPGWQLASGIIDPPIVFKKNKLLVITRGGMAYLLELKKRDDDF